MRMSIGSALAGAAVVGSVVVGGLVVAPAAAQAATTTRITLTIQREDHTRSSVWFGCSPARGTHTAAPAACATLAKVGGNIKAIRPEQGMCTAQYAPVVAMATGIWRGKPVRYRQTFSNECVLHLKTDVLFRI